MIAIQWPTEIHRRNIYAFYHTHLIIRLLIFYTYRVAPKILSIYANCAAIEILIRFYDMIRIR